MGKKGRKTRWRRLPMGDVIKVGTNRSISSQKSKKKEWPESAASSQVEEQGPNDSPSPEHRITFNEDEYTKITTPRQDVLFKKGYLGRRRANNPTPDAQEIHSADSMESEYIPEEQPQYAYVPSTGFIDHTGVLYVNSGTYEIYDPYSGNVTVVVGPAPQYPPHPVLAAMPCQPVPLTPLEWFNPPAPWVNQYNNRRKRYSTDSQNCSAQSSESTGPPGSPQEPIDEAAASVMYSPQPQPGYMYPGYMFGAPVYNMNGVNVQGVVPQPLVSTTIDPTSTTTKRRKKRRRRRRGGVTDEGSESSCEEVINCDGGVCSQSGASSDAGQGSSCSKTNSDSGINTEPMPDSGSNTPPLEIQLTNGQSFEESCVKEDSIQQYELENDVDLELNSSSVSTPEAHKRTFESLPSEDGETLQELSCSSEINELKLTTCNSDFTESKFDTCSSELVSYESELMDSSISITEPCPTTDANDSLSHQMEQNKTELSSPDEAVSEPHVEFCVDTKEIDIEPSTLSTLLINGVPQFEQVDHSNDEVIVTSSKLPIEDSTDCDERQEKLIDSVTESVEELVLNDQITTVENAPISDELENVEENVTEILLHENVNETDDKETTVENNSTEKNSRNIIILENNVDQTVIEVTQETCIGQSEPESEASVNSEISRPSGNSMPVNFNQFSSCSASLAPVPPPRRRRSLYRSAEKVAKKVVDDAVNEGIKEAACKKCQNALPITEAVTRWLQSQGPTVLSTKDMGDDNDNDDDEDEGIEDGEGSTNQKNVEGNPFLVPYLSGSGRRVANDSDECGSLVSSAGEWDMYDHDGYTRVICDPATSVDKYYRLSTDDLDDKITSSPSMIKTAVHIRRAGPFPCGVCCIIQ